MFSRAKIETLLSRSPLAQGTLRLKRYYEQLDSIFDEMDANDNGLLSGQTLKRIAILGARTDRYLRAVQNLQEIVNQMREEYQSQLSIRQNDLSGCLPS